MEVSRLELEFRPCKGRVMPDYTIPPRLYMKTIIKTCKFCKKSFNAPVREVKRGNGKFCSKRCCSNSRRGIVINPRIPNVTCAYCKKKFYKPESKIKKSKSGLVFCSRKHKDLGQRIESGLTEIHPPHYGTAEISDYRSIAFSSKEKVCELCGYNTIPQILQVHHIDENRKNNSIDNLQVLCPNCHHETHYNKGTGFYTNNIK
jgi:hypothetical protein